MILGNLMWVVSLVVQYRKIAAISAAVLVVGIAGCQYRANLIEKGRQDAIKKIELDNRRSQATADEIERRVAACHEAGKNWDREANRCE